MPLTMSRLGVSLCPVDGVVEDREVPDRVSDGSMEDRKVCDRVSDGSTVVHGSQLTTFVL